MYFYLKVHNELLHDFNLFVFEFFTDVRENTVDQLFDFLQLVQKVLRGRTVKTIVHLFMVIRNSTLRCFQFGGDSVHLRLEGGLCGGIVDFIAFVGKTAQS